VDGVKTLTIDGDKIMGEFRKTEAIDDQQVGKFQTPLPAGSSQTWELTKWVLENRHNAKVIVENSPNWVLQVIVPLIPWLLIFGFIWFFVFRQLRNSAGAGGMLGNFGRSRHKITFQGTHERHLRRCGRRGRGQGRGDGDRRVPQEPEEVPTPGWSHSARRASGR
jgi:ATP-dependent Zn protease